MSLCSIDFLFNNNTLFDNNERNKNIYDNDNNIKPIEVNFNNNEYIISLSFSLFPSISLALLSDVHDDDYRTYFW